jgi:hypothetical protein
MLGNVSQDTVQKLLIALGYSDEPEPLIPNSWPKQMFQLSLYPCNEAYCFYARLWLVLNGNGAEA